MTIGYGLTPYGLGPYGDILPSRVIHLAAPPFPLTRVRGDGTNERAAVQAALDYVADEWGSGAVEGLWGQEIRCNTGLTVPAGVQLRHITLDNTGMTGGSAVTVNGHNGAPLVDVTLTGPGRASTVTGFDIFGVGQTFYNLTATGFGRAVDVAHSETFINTIAGGSFGENGVGLYADMEARAASNAGEGVVLAGVTIYNSDLGFRATGNGLHLDFVAGSRIDFCAEYGQVLNAWVRFSAAHLETKAGSGGTIGNYLFDVAGNSKMAFSGTHVIMGGGDGSDLFHLFKSITGPANYANGRATFDDTCSIYCVTPANTEQTQWGDWMVAWPAGQTTQTFHSAFPLKWCALSVEFCTTDNYLAAASGADHPYVSAVAAGSGSFTVTAPANANHRWLRVRF